MDLSEPDVIAEALERPSGAHFVRCALQVNPHHYRGSYRNSPNEGDAASYAVSLVEKARELGIGVLAITDHNSVQDVAAFQEAASGTDITVLPGFELESTDGIHVLCIYDSGTTIAHLNRLLGEFGIRDPEPSREACGKDFTTILEMVSNQGGDCHRGTRRWVEGALQSSPRSRSGAGVEERAPLGHADSLVDWCA